MFNSRHYVPILKWKRAEMSALKMLKKEHKEYITPLVQLVMPSVYLYKKENGKNVRKSPEEILTEKVTKLKGNRIKKAPEEILQSWGTRPIFLDVSLLYDNQSSIELKENSMKEVILNGSKIGLNIIPVIHINDDLQIRKISCLLAKEFNSGLCLRLVCPNLENIDQLDRSITELITNEKLNIGDIDLLIDIKETEDNDQKYIKYLNISQNIPRISEWRTFIFASGSFSKDLSDLIFGEYYIPRLDWTNWINLINRDLKRKPTFADYTIQHPIYKESSQFFHPSASIKYTLENKWLVMKGKKQKYGHYLAHAAAIVSSNKYYGERFSYGDKYISEKAKHYTKYITEKDKGHNIGGTGSTETWLRAGINHHMTLVVHQIANLS